MGVRWLRCVFVLGLSGHGAFAEEPPVVPVEVLRAWETARVDPRARREETAPTATALTLDRLRLANGLDVVLAPDARSAHVRVLVTVNVGDGDAPDGQLQAAHVAEHLLFRDAPGLHPLGSVFAELSAGRGGGTTYSDRTLYETEVRPEHIERLLWLESVRLAQAEAYVRADALAHERSILQHELALTTWRWPFLRGLALRAALPETHRSHARWGSLGALDSLQQHAVLELVHARYAPGNARLTVVGGFEAAAVRAWIDRYFAPIPARATPPRPREDGPFDFVRTHLRARTVHPATVVIAWPGVALDDCRNANLRALVAVLRASISARPEFGAQASDGTRWSLEPVRQGSHIAVVFEARAEVGGDHGATLRAMDAALHDSVSALSSLHAMPSAIASSLDESLAEAARDLGARASSIADLPSAVDPGGFRCARSATRALEVTTLRELAGRVFAARRLVVEARRDPTAVGLQIDEETL